MTAPPPMASKPGPGRMSIGTPTSMIAPPMTVCAAPPMRLGLFAGGGPPSMTVARTALSEALAPRLPCAPYEGGRKPLCAAPAAPSRALDTGSMSMMGSCVLIGPPQSLPAFAVSLRLRSFASVPIIGSPAMRASRRRCGRPIRHRSVTRCPRLLQRCAVARPRLGAWGVGGGARCCGVRRAQRLSRGTVAAGGGAPAVVGAASRRLSGRRFGRCRLSRGVVAVGMAGLVGAGAAAARDGCYRSGALGVKR